MRGRKKLTRKLGRGKAVTRRLSPEEKEARAKREQFLWLANNTGKDIETRIKIVSTCFLIPPADLRALVSQARELDSKDLAEAPLVVELMAQGRHAPEGDSESRYDPNYGTREVMLAIAQSFEEGREEVADKVPLAAQKELAVIICESMVSQTTAFDLTEDLYQRLEQDPSFAYSHTTWGLTRGLHELEGEAQTADKETLGYLLYNLEGQRQAVEDNPSHKKCLLHSLANVADILQPGAGDAFRPKTKAKPKAKARPKPPAKKKSEPVVARVITETPEAEAEIIREAPSGGGGALTPKDVVKLMNTHDAKTKVSAVLDKIPLEGFSKDAFVVHFLKKAGEDDGLSLRRKMLLYVFKNLLSDSRKDYKKAVSLAKHLIGKDFGGKEEHEQVKLVKSKLGLTIMETLDILFDKKLGSLSERTERARPFLSAVAENKEALVGFIQGLSERLKEKPLSFREPGVQTLVRHFSTHTPADDRRNMRNIERIQSSINESKEKAENDQLKFPSGRSRSYFMECAQTLLDALGRLD